MKIVIAPDSFKESMSAKCACQSIQKAVLTYDPHIETVLCPMADGGEGTLETLIEALNGTIEYYDVCGPLFQKIKAPIGYIDDLAIIECAKVCGLELLKEEQKDPLQTTTYGLGQLIKIALKQDVHKIMVCLGGSATNDGGIGMLSALGVHFFNHSHEVTLTMAGLQDIEEFDISSLDQRLKTCEIIAVCDVKNCLCGQNGATYTYGPQKGIKKEQLASVDQAMFQYASLIDDYFQYSFKDIAGSGAAGGLGYAFIAFMGGQLRNGFDIVNEVIGLEKEIKDCDFVIVGEGKIDRQTQFGKTPYGVLKIAQKYQKPVFAFGGKVEDEQLLRTLGFQDIFQITPIDMKLAEALKKGSYHLELSVQNNMEVMINEI